MQHPLRLRGVHRRDRKLRTLPPRVINSDNRPAVMPAQASRPPITVGNDTPIADIKVGRQHGSVRAVLSAEGRPVVCNARSLADEVGAEGLQEGALDDENVCAKDFAGGDLAVCVAVGAGGVDDGALGLLVGVV
jgi:hypothetical protein